MESDLALRASMKPRLVKPRGTKGYELRLPGLGRIAFTRDPGDGDIFSQFLMRTSLRALIRDPAGRLLEERDLGSGKVTNVGTLQLANDMAWAAPSGAAMNTFALQKWHAWGTSETAAANTDLKVITPAAPTATEAVEATTTVLQSAANKQKIVSTSKITAGGTLKITEWGIHSDKVLKSAEETATAAAATSITGTATPYTASSGTVRGVVTSGGQPVQGEIVVAVTAEEVWGLATKNTSSVVTVPAWYKATDGTAGATPSATTKYFFRPVMFDRRQFGVLTVETGNSIEFPWELEIVAGG